MTKLELLEHILNEFDPDVLQQCHWRYHSLKKHPWMKYRKDQIEAAAASTRENFYRLELGGNVNWYGYISNYLKQNKNRENQAKLAHDAWQIAEIETAIIEADKGDFEPTNAMEAKLQQLSRRD